uniref:Palmitoyltransferase n=1 Tax=Alexandrium catenella TaxID=2925 RepID=A0A7S1MFG2_ALECA|mmetsp:Transcript_25384/g.69297  ORF Transcript_25384/g.69297 Transcript_25384/m.69297 type:complete len:329 (+) Transcript_25384:147-1133(+)
MAHRVYGNNKVFLQGRLISGPDVRSCAFSVVMIAAPSVLWHIEVGEFFATRYSIVMPIVVGLMQAASLLLLVCTAFSDPGIMPRQKDYAEQYDPRSNTYRAKQPPRYFEVLVRGHPFKLKYCTTCNIYRPPRCTHCSVCENCIERFDHHCPWIGNCIGKRNYWLFYSFVSFTGAMNATVLATSVAQLFILTQEIGESDGLGGGDALVKALSREPITAAVAVYCTAVVWFTVGLCLYHNYLVCTNQTTYEQIKGAYSVGNNPFHMGAFANWQEILCSRVRPRYFNPFTGKLLWPPTPAEFTPSVTAAVASAPLRKAAPTAGETTAGAAS